MKVTSEQCGDMLFDWLRLHCNSKAMKAVSKDVGYKYSFFSRSKQLHLMEELVFLYISLVIYGVNVALDDDSTIKSVVDAFLVKMRKILDNFASDDEGFSKRYTERVDSYFELLWPGGNDIVVAGDFMVGLFGTTDARLKFNAIKVSISVSNAQNSLQDIFQEIEISDDKAGSTDKKNPLDAFSEEIQNWPEQDAKTALLLLKAINSGDQDKVENLYPNLTLNQIKAVEAVLREMENE